MSKFGCNKVNVLLVVDIRGWAYENIALQISRLLSCEYSIEILSRDDFDSDEDLFAHILKCRPNLVHFFWREYLFRVISNKYSLEEVALKINLENQELIKLLLEIKITSSVYDHLFLGSNELGYREKLFDFLDGYWFSSAKLKRIYCNTWDDIMPNDQPIIMDGVDLNKFKICKDFDCVKKTLVIGWVGNSEWAKNQSDIDYKGYHSLFKPVVDDLKKKYSLHILVADKSQNYISHNKMSSYYDQIDILVISSLHEGTPNPLLEAMAKGKAIVTTNVGICREVFGTLQKEFILEKRNTETLYKKLECMINNRQLIKDISRENINQIRHHDWESRKILFAEFITNSLNNRNYKYRKYYLRGILFSDFVNKGVNASILYSIQSVEINQRKILYRISIWEKRLIGIFRLFTSWKRIGKKYFNK